MPPVPLDQLPHKGALPIEGFVLTLLSEALSPSKSKVRIDAPPVEFDWSAFVQCATRHGVIAWLAQVLDAVPDVPDQVVATVRQARLGVAQRNLFLAAELVRVVQALDVQGLEVLAFKGVVAAAQLHGDLAIRPSGDLDLLVREADWEAAAEVLEGQGYALDKLWDNSLQGGFWHEGRQTMIDLHWGVPPVYLTLNAGSLWAHRGHVDVLGAPIPTFAMEDTTLVAAINVMKEHWNTFLHQTVDVTAALACLDDGGWRALRRRARAIGCERALLAAAYVCTNLYSNRFTSELARDVLVSAPAKQAGNEILAWMFLEPRPEDRQVVALRSDHVYQRLLMDRAWHRVAAWTRETVRRARWKLKSAFGRVPA